MKLKLTEEFTHKLTTLQKEIIEHINQVTNRDEEPGPLDLALAGITKEEFQNQSVNVDVPDPVDEEQTENSEIESDESDSEIDISNIRYAIYSESEED